MTHYPASVIRNAKHLIELGEAVLAGKPIERLSIDPVFDMRSWVPIDADMKLFSKTCSTYRVSRNQQLELPKVTRQPPEPEGMVPLDDPPKSSGWASNATWEGDRFTLSLPLSTSHPSFSRSQALRMLEALDRFLGSQPKETTTMTPQRTKELLPVLQAYAEGKTIQYKETAAHAWSEQTSYDFANPTGVYRVKPEPTRRPWKLEEIPVGAMLTCARATVANQDGRDFLIVGAMVPVGSPVPMLRTTRWFPNTESVIADTFDQMPGLRKWYWPNEPNILRPVGVLEEPK